MTVEAAELPSTEDGIVLRQKYVGHNDRHATDRYWSGLFVVVFVIWIASWQYLSHHEKDYKVHNTSQNDIDMRNTQEFVRNDFSWEYDVFYSLTENTSPALVSNYWGKYWIFDALTFNFGFLDVHYERSGPIVICANTLLSIGLIFYALATMRRDRFYFKQICYFRTPMLASLLYYRFIVILPNRLDVMSLIPFDRKITEWIVPELILIVTWIVKEAIGCVGYGEGDPHGVSNNDKKIQKTGGSKTNLYNCSFKKFIGYVMLIGMALFSCIEILIFVTTARVYELGWDNPLFYLITGGSLYVGLTFFFFGLMVISCATGMSFESRAMSLKDLLRAFYVVGRYHFGTACYHATLVLPRLHATIVANQAEFRKMPKFTLTVRFTEIHYWIHNVSPTFTAVLGKNHSGSIREMLRQYNAGFSSRLYFQGFSRICTNDLVVAIASNSLCIIMFWFDDVEMTPRFLMGTWVMYLVVTFMNYIFMRAHDAAADTIWLLVKRSKQVEF